MCMGTIPFAYAKLISAPFILKDNELKQFLTSDIITNPVTPTAFIPFGWFHAVDSLLQCPRDELNRFHLTWEIMELSRVGYHELFIHGRDFDDSQKTFLTLLRLALRKYLDSIEFSIALAFADIAIGQYFNGTEVLLRFYNDVRIPGSYQDTIRQLREEWVHVAIHSRISNPIAHCGSMRSRTFHLQRSVHFSEVEEFDKHAGQVLGLMSLRSSLNLPVVRSISPLVNLEKSSLHERVKLDSIDTLVKNHWGPLGKRILDTFIHVLGGFSGPSVM